MAFTVAPTLRRFVRGTTAEGGDQNLQIDPTGADSASGAPDPQAGALTNDQSANRFAPAPQVTAPPKPAAPLPMDRGDMEEQPSDAAMAGAKPPIPASPAPAPTPGAVAGPDDSSQNDTPFKQEIKNMRGLTNQEQGIRDNVADISRQKTENLNAPISRWRKFGAVMAGVGAGILTKNPSAGLQAYEDVRLQPAREKNLPLDQRLADQQQQQKFLQDQIETEKSIMQSMAPQYETVDQLNPADPTQVGKGLVNKREGLMTGQPPVAHYIPNTFAPGTGPKGEASTYSGADITTRLQREKEQGNPNADQLMAGIDPNKQYRIRSGASGFIAEVTGATTPSHVNASHNIYIDGKGQYHQVVNLIDKMTPTNNQTLMIDEKGNSVPIDSVPPDWKMLPPASYLPTQSTTTGQATVLDNKGNQSVKTFPKAASSQKVLPGQGAPQGVPQPQQPAPAPAPATAQPQGAPGGAPKPAPAAPAGGYGTVATGRSAAGAKRDLETGDLTPAGEQHLQGVEPIKGQFDGILRDIDTLGMRDRNTPLSTFKARAKYAAGMVSPEGTIGNDISQLSLASITGTMQYAHGSKNFALIQKIQEHLPNAWIDAPAKMFDQLVKARRQINKYETATVKTELKDIKPDQEQHALASQQDADFYMLAAKDDMPKAKQMMAEDGYTGLLQGATIKVQKQKK